MKITLIAQVGGDTQRHEFCGDDRDLIDMAIDAQKAKILDKDGDATFTVDDTQED